MAIKINGNTVIADNQAFTTTSTISATGNITTAGVFIGNVQSTGPLSTTGNITGGNILTGGVVSATGNITGNFILGNGSQLTGIDATSIQNGTANVRTFNNGNVTTSAGGTANVLNVTSTGTITTGTASVSGTVTGGNIATAGTVSATGNITGNFILGNGSQLTGIDATSIQSGTSNVRVVSSGGNVAMGIGGTANVVVVATTGQFVTGVNSVSGNITGGNLLTGGLLSATANVTGGNITTAGLVSATGNIIGGNLIINNNATITGNLTVSGTETIFNVANLTVNDKDIIVANNVTGGANVNGAGLQAGNPATATWFFNNATTSWQSNIGITPSANGTLALGGASNYWGNAFITAASVSGNVTGGNILTAGLISATGNVSGGNLNVTGNIVDTGALSIITGSNGNLTLNAGTGFIIASSSILNGQANGVGNIGNSTGYFNTIFAKATSAQYADLAEKYTADADYEPGTVVMFGGAEEVTACTNDACRRVAGVISTNPSYIMNGTLESTHVATVALTGRVPTKVSGTVRKGDLMVSAGNGRARAEADPQVGTVIGKALADHDGAEGTIEVVVGRF